MSSITKYTPEQRKRRAEATKKWRRANPDKVKAQPCNTREAANARLREWRKRQRDEEALKSSAPVLLCLLERLLDGVLRLPELPATLSLLDIEQARAAIAKAKGVTL